MLKNRALRSVRIFENSDHFQIERSWVNITLNVIRSPIFNPRLSARSFETMHPVRAVKGTPASGLRAFPIEFGCSKKRTGSTPNLAKKFFWSRLSLYVPPYQFHGVHFFHARYSADFFFIGSRNRLRKRNFVPHNQAKRLAGCCVRMKKGVIDGEQDAEQAKRNRDARNQSANYAACCAMYF